MGMIPKTYINAVVAIGVKKDNGVFSWSATGFLVTRKVSEDRVALFLITNRHVLNNKKSIVIRMKEKDTEQLKDLEYQIVSTEGVPLYKLHKNKEVDIAVLPLKKDFITNNHLEFPAFDIDANAMTSAELRANGAEEGTLVYMLGFPMGLVDPHSNVPICRLGCVARMCEAQIKDTHNILLDIQNFPGNSGSPIVTRPESVGIIGTRHLARSVLVGIVHSYLPYREHLMNIQTREIVEAKTENSGIANVHPVEYIREIIDEIQPIPRPNA